jgi:hypothetical protein
MNMPSSNHEPKTPNNFFPLIILQDSMLYSTAKPPAKATPSIPQAAVCRGTAAPLEVVEVVLDEDEDEDELEPELEL